MPRLAEFGKGRQLVVGNSTILAVDRVALPLDSSRNSGRSIRGRHFLSVLMCDGSESTAVRMRKTFERGRSLGQATMALTEDRESTDSNNPTVMSASFSPLFPLRSLASRRLLRRGRNADRIVRSRSCLRCCEGRLLPTRTPVAHSVARSNENAN